MSNQQRVLADEEQCRGLFEHCNSQFGARHLFNAPAVTAEAGANEMTVSGSSFL
jgi:hypothetical protein